MLLGWGRLSDQRYDGETPHTAKPRPPGPLGWRRPSAAWTTTAMLLPRGPWIAPRERAPSHSPHLYTFTRDPVWPVHGELRPVRAFATIPRNWRYSSLGIGRAAVESEPRLTKENAGNEEARRRQSGTGEFSERARPRGVAPVEPGVRVGVRASRSIRCISTGLGLRT
jgi:hypothetical protein